MTNEADSDALGRFCRVIRATPTGRAAVASLLLVGRDALSVVAPFLIFPRHAISEPFAEQTPIFAYFQLPDTNSREEIVVHFRQNDMLELHCHGGDAVLNAIEHSLVENGATRQTWDAWLREKPVQCDAKSFVLPDVLSPEAVRRDALRLLPLAETELTAQLLLTQYHGAISRRIDHAMDLSNLPNDEAKREAIAVIDLLLDSYALGKHLVTPFRVSLVGAVNAGKSSLMNALLGFNRSITSQTAGTTRDTVSAKTVINGWPVVLVDTAGFRETANPIEQEGILRTRAAIDDSNLVLHVIDASRNLSVDGELLSNGFSKTPHLHVFNKIDLVGQKAESFFTKISEGISVSATTAYGIDRLCHLLMPSLCQTDKCSVPVCDQDDLPLVFTERQYAALIQWRKVLVCENRSLE